MKELMVHVERIVRPVHATQRRKLHMRRELLGHLQAAYQEELAKGREDVAALEAAKQRLGDSAGLTRSLQQSVPWPQRLLLARVPMPRWSTAMETWMGRDMGTLGMSLGPAALLTLGCMVVTYGTLVLLAMDIVSKYRAEMMRGLAEQMWQFKVAAIAEAGFLIIIMGACFSIAGAVAKAGWKFKPLLTRGVCLTGALLAWTTLVVTMSAGQRLQAVEILWTMLAAVSLMGLTGLVGFLAQKMGRPYAEWLSLNLSDSSAKA